MALSSFCGAPFESSWAYKRSTDLTPNCTVRVLVLRNLILFSFGWTNVFMCIFITWFKLDTQQLVFSLVSQKWALCLFWPDDPFKRLRYNSHTSEVSKTFGVEWSAGVVWVISCCADVARDQQMTGGHLIASYIIMQNGSGHLKQWHSGVSVWAVWLIQPFYVDLKMWIVFQPCAVAALGSVHCSVHCDFLQSTEALWSHPKESSLQEWGGDSSQTISNWTLSVGLFAFCLIGIYRVTHFVVFLFMVHV